MKYLLIIICLAVPSQARADDKKIADVISYVSLAADIAIDTNNSLHCSNKKNCLITQTLKDGGIVLTSELIKHYFPDKRPCYPDCGIDNPLANMPSEHNALAWGSLVPVKQKSFSFSLSMGIVTAAGRYKAKKHDVKAIVIGALIGSGFDYLSHRFTE